MSDEAAFQQWIRALPWFEQFKQRYGEEPDLNTPHYDYRAAYRAGVTPQPDPYDNNMFHWDSRFKAKSHPTHWKGVYMDRTGRNPDADGVTPRVFDKLFGGE